MSLTIAHGSRVRSFRFFMLTLIGDDDGDVRRVEVFYVVHGGGKLCVAQPPETAQLVVAHPFFIELSSTSQHLKFDGLQSASAGGHSVCLVHPP